METESLWVRVKWQLVNVVNVILLSTFFDGCVSATLGELETFIADAILDVSSKDGLDKSDILIIRNSTTIVNFSSQVVQHLVRDNFVII